jgi:hypothetical protein
VVAVRLGVHKYLIVGIQAWKKSKGEDAKGEFKEKRGGKGIYPLKPKNEEQLQKLHCL